MTRSTPLLLAFVLPILAGCPSAGDDRLPSCVVPDDMGLNTVVANVDGDAWVGDTSGYQTVAGPAMQVSATGQDDDGDSVNIVLRLLRGAVWSIDEETDEMVVDEGALIEDALADQDAPYDFEMGDANDQGANATVTRSPQPSMSTGEGDGTGFLRITFIGVPADAQDGAPEEVVGCFELDASSQDGSATVSLTDGGFRLTAM